MTGSVQIPVAVSLAPALPVVGRAVLAAFRWKVVRQPIPAEQKRVEQHRSLIAGLAAFSLAGFALISIQAEQRVGAALFDIVVSFFCFLASLGVQSWKSVWWHDLAGDGLRDAATTALILFALRLAFALGPDLGWNAWQLAAVAVLAALTWLVDAGSSLLHSALWLWSAGPHPPKGESK